MTHMAKVGCPIDESFFRCHPCIGMHGGYFAVDEKGNAGVWFWLDCLRTVGEHQLQLWFAFLACFRSSSALIAKYSRARFRKP